MQIAPLQKVTDPRMAESVMLCAILGTHKGHGAPTPFAILGTHKNHGAPAPFDSDDLIA